MYMCSTLHNLQEYGCIGVLCTLLHSNKEWKICKEVKRFIECQFPTFIETITHCISLLTHLRTFSAIEQFLCSYQNIMYEYSQTIFSNFYRY